ncbi:sulfotransferase domain-containing protein [Burkholderia ubonensis]|uniref:sulfotransferase domain-containing protein n=1 Tax=Burkholderia ubonensis TaxID=101571 RepID=UPI000758E32F|nr:sulfotransferase domain-containing protein [Burkholderia ubonensis]KVZ88170.1 hypothetical protein WL25_25930 [Burkholderia ubonensis]KWD52096.1 hypothetical protein WL66_17410 [Burkholderia ubonensis]KWD69753.1 hypothetical protein WL67_26975 [Burkholderia ubonensis]
MNLSRTVFSFGSPCNGQYGHLVLRDSGEIYGYSHPNEHRWSLADGELRLHSIDGNVTSRFRSDDESGAWLGCVDKKKWPLYLVPVVRLEANMPTPDSAPSFPSYFVNSIPKSGTYFVEAALQEMGVKSQRLHLSGRDTIHDYRGHAEEQIHVNPDAVYLQCPIELVTALLREEQVVGHVEHQSTVDRIREQNVTVLSVVRDLRNVLVSLFRFKTTKVAPNGTLDEYWRSLNGAEQIIGFLLYYADRDIAHIRTMAEMMAADRDSIMLQYEALSTGTLTADAATRLNERHPGSAERLCESLKNQCGRRNPTFSGKASDWRSVWNDDLERFFNATGLAALNHALGYA